jgi:hypothetical protein
MSRVKSNRLVTQVKEKVVRGWERGRVVTWTKRDEDRRESGIGKAAGRYECGVEERDPEEC